MIRHLLDDESLFHQFEIFNWSQYSKPIYFNNIIFLTFLKFSLGEWNNDEMVKSLLFGLKLHFIVFKIIYNRKKGIITFQMEMNTLVVF